MTTCRYERGCDIASADVFGQRARDLCRDIGRQIAARLQ
jgi:hypothetical protein